MQIGNSTYIGEYSDAIGTNLFFSETSKSKEVMQLLILFNTESFIVIIMLPFREL